MSYSLGSYKVHIADSALLLMLSYQQKKPTSKEAGGIILGQIKGQSLFITKVATPTALDKRSRFGFVRHKDSAQIIVDYEFKNSNGKTIYLGEWHTHPENNPVPSSVDIAGIKKQMKRPIANFKESLMIIIGLKTIYIRLITKDDFFETTIKIN